VEQGPEAAESSALHRRLSNTIHWTKKAGGGERGSLQSGNETVTPSGREITYVFGVKIEEGHGVNDGKAELPVR